MRKPIVAGNWKMNKTASGAKEFAEAVKSKIPSNDKVDSVVGSPALFLQELMTSVKGTKLKISARNCYQESLGAFTSETSSAALAGLGVRYVIIGHSGRREYFHKTNENISKRAKAIFTNGMTSILRRDEPLEAYEAGKTAEWIEGQIIAGLTDLPAEQVSDMIIAYGPIWAIGASKSANAQITDEIYGVVRRAAEELYGEEVSEAVRIRYGGSIKPESIAEYMAKENVDSALVDGVSLQADSFLSLLDTVR